VKDLPGPDAVEYVLAKARLDLYPRNFCGLSHLMGESTSLAGLWGTKLTLDELCCAFIVLKLDIPLL